MGKTSAVSMADEKEIAEARRSTLPDMLHDVVARVATTSIGQFVYKRTDNLLWTVEKTARWSLPQQAPIGAEGKVKSVSAAAVAAVDSRASEENEDARTEISGPPLIRPLPWLIFLPALIVLRLIRTALTMGARVIGRGPVLPSTMVSFLQNKRRKLRALKYRGQRLRRISQQEKISAQNKNTATWLERIILPLKMVICTRPYKTVDGDSDVAHAVVFRRDRPLGPSQKRSAVSRKRNLNQREAESAEDDGSDEDSFGDAGCKELLEKYANITDDSSFNVEDISSVSDDSSSLQSDSDHSPVKLHHEATEPQAQPRQNGGQQPIPKPENPKLPASDNKNGTDTHRQSTKTSSTKSINAANRSKSAAELEKGNNSQPNGAGADGSSNATITTPSKSISNLSSSPENNENKPINQNTVAGPAAALPATGPMKSPSQTVLKPVVKQSPTMSDVRHSFQQQKQTAKQLQPSVPAAQQQHPQQQPPHISNGGKNRNKKTPTQSVG